MLWAVAGHQVTAKGRGSTVKSTAAQGALLQLGDRAVYMWHETWIGGYIILWLYRLGIPTAPARAQAGCPGLCLPKEGAGTETAEMGSKTPDLPLPCFGPAWVLTGTEPLPQCLPAMCSDSLSGRISWGKEGPCLGSSGLEPAPPCQRKATAALLLVGFSFKTDKQQDLDRFFQL